MGGNEINAIRPGRNYGEPNASNGSNYDGTDIPITSQDLVESVDLAG